MNAFHHCNSGMEKCKTALGVDGSTGSWQLHANNKLSESLGPRQAFDQLCKQLYQGIGAKH